jgi:hypothetical protein
MSWTPITWPSSSAIAVNTSDWDASCATSVATRRRAACSFASPDRALRASAPAIAVAISSVNSSIRRSVSDGRGSLAVVAAISAPQRRPSTTIGAATLERIPKLVAMAATLPVLSAQLSKRVVRPVRSSSAMMF